MLPRSELVAHSKGSEDRGSVSQLFIEKQSLLVCVPARGEGAVERDGSMLFLGNLSPCCVQAIQTTNKRLAVCYSLSFHVIVPSETVTHQD